MVHLGQLVDSIKYWESTGVLIECWLTVNEGWWLRISIDTELCKSLVCMILIFLWLKMTQTYLWTKIITRATVGKPESENATVLSQKGGHGPRRSMHRLWKQGTRNATLLACDRIRCFESFGKYRAIYIHLAYKDVDLFPKGSVLESYSSKPAR